MRADSREYGDMPFGVSETNGAFRTVGVPPGPYTLIALPAPFGGPTHWRMASALVGGRNVADTQFEIGDTDVTDVLVTMRLRVGTLSGTVRDASGALRADTSLYIFSADRERWKPPSFMWVSGVPREIRPNRHGAYTAELIDGEYYVAATTDHRASWRTPETLAELAKTATKISLAAGEQKSIDVTVRERLSGAWSLKPGA
jgi:hypothetical protein